MASEDLARLAALLGAHTAASRGGSGGGGGVRDLDDMMASIFGGGRAGRAGRGGHGSSNPASSGETSGEREEAKRRKAATDVVNSIKAVIGARVPAMGSVVTAMLDDVRAGPLTLAECADLLVRMAAVESLEAARALIAKLEREGRATAAAPGRRPVTGLFSEDDADADDDSNDDDDGTNDDADDDADAKTKRRAPHETALPAWPSAKALSGRVWVHLPTLVPENGTQQVIKAAKWLMKHEVASMGDMTPAEIAAVMMITGDALQRFLLDLVQWDAVEAKFGVPLLAFAVLTEDPELLELCLEPGRPTSLGSHNFLVSFNTAVAMASTLKDGSCVNLLLEFADKHRITVDGDVLWFAFANQRFGTTRSLLTHFAKPGGAVEPDKRRAFFRKALTEFVVDAASVHSEVYFLCQVRVQLLRHHVHMIISPLTGTVVDAAGFGRDLLGKASAPQLA
jgi:hypothetical protein